MATTKRRQLERRYTTGEVEIRSQGDHAYIEGYAAVFGKLSENLGGFVEDVNCRAFNKTVRESDVRALWNHDANYVLGRRSAGTVALSVDASGLYYRIDPPGTQWARDLQITMERRDVRESSFSFFTIDDDWGLTGEGFPKRELLQVALLDVGPVTFPAYPDATSGLGAGRMAALAGLAKRSGIPVEQLEQMDLRSLLAERVTLPEAEGSAEELVGLLSTPDGGFTIDVHKDGSRDTGYAVARNLERSRCLSVQDVKPETLHTYVKENADVLGEPGSRFGGWHDPDTHQVWLTVSHVVASRQEAVDLGKARNQIAIFDLDKMESILTGGTGRSLPDGAEQRAVSDAPWAQFSASDYSEEQWARACLVDMGEDVNGKQRYKVPVREPDGVLNKNGVHAATGGHGLPAVKGIDDTQRAAVAKKICALYRTDLEEEPPDSMRMMAGEKMDGGGRSTNTIDWQARANRLAELDRLLTLAA